MAELEIGYKTADSHPYCLDSGKEMEIYNIFSKSH